MSEPVHDPADYCKMTESWLSEKDLREPVTQTEAGDGAQPGDDEDQAVELDEPYDFDDGDALPPTQGGTDDDYFDTGPDLDSADIPDGELGPDEVDAAAGEPADGHDDDTPPASEAAKARFNTRLAAGFVAATVAASVLAAGAMLAMRSEPHTEQADHLAPAPGRPSAGAAAPTTTATAEGTDPPVPYTATAVGCLPGSTAAQSAAGADPTQALVCVTGGNIGQYVRLNLGRPTVITAACVASGWVGSDASGADQWKQHGVITRVQWSFNDSPPTVVPKDTDSVHGDACQPMPNHGVLASTVVMLVQGIGRAPADTAPTTPPPAVEGGPLGQILGTPAEPAPPSDPALPADHSHTDAADNTWATSSIKLFGHPPQ